MGEIRRPSPVLLIIAAFAPEDASLDWGRKQAESLYGPIWRESPVFYFNEFTQYYEREMGPILKKKFWAFENLIDMGDLASIKVTTNGLEEEWAKIRCLQTPADLEASLPPRPLNLDPGYIDLGKLILASTKDHFHRIYLNSGIFAETTLYYSQKKWQKLPWTYPDYQSEGYQTFFTECRNYLHQRQRENPLVIKKA